MLALNTLKNIAMVAMLAAFVIGCAKENSSGPVADNTPVPGPYVPPGSTVSDNPDSSFDYGATTNFVIEGDSVSEKAINLTRYAGEERYNPRDVKINVNLVKRGSGFGGRIQVAYYDEAYNQYSTLQANKFHKGVFVNGDDAYFYNKSKTESAKYNIWFQKSGKTVFHGFFQDLNGPIIMVIDDVESTGDGQAPSKASGSIWYKNFSIGPNTAPHSPTHCWLISLGPYDCRAWESGKGIDTKRAINPDQGYVKLGTFTGLDIKKAFNTDLTNIL